MSNLGDHEQAELLKNLLKKNSDLVTYQKSGASSRKFLKSQSKHTPVKKPEDIPYIKELTSTLNFSAVKNPMGRNQLEHNMELTKELPKVIPQIKVKYD